MATVRASAAGGASAGTSDRTVTIVPAVGDLLVVLGVVSVNTNDTPTMTDDNGSGTYSRVAVANKATNADRMFAFIRTALMTNTTSTIITATTGSNTAGELVAVAVAGSRRMGCTALRQMTKQENQAATGTPTPVFTANALTGNLIIGAVGNATNPPTLTAPTNTTELQDVGQASPCTGLEVVSLNSGCTGTTLQWVNNSATAFASIMLEIDASELDTSLNAPIYRTRHRTW